MPGQDGNGPIWGGGPGAGRGMGTCGAGRGWGGSFGRGRVRGPGWGFVPGRRYGGYNYGYRMSRDDQLKMIEDEETALRGELEDLQRAKQQLDSEKNPSK